MRRLRPLVNTLMGLLFLVQGVAVAGAPLQVASADEAPAQAEVAAPAMDHCAKAAAKADAEGAPSRGCCDEGCPNMTTCLLGHVAIAGSVRPEFAPMRAPHDAPPVAALRSASTQSLLRPPIALHG